MRRDSRERNWEVTCVRVGYLPEDVVRLSFLPILWKRFLERGVVSVLSLNLFVRLGGHDLSVYDLVNTCEGKSTRNSENLGEKPSPLILFYLNIQKDAVLVSVSR